MDKQRFTVTVFLNGINEWDRAYLATSIREAVDHAMRSVLKRRGVDPDSAEGNELRALMKVHSDYECACPAVVEEI